jgi:putative PIN family toxin of toxin-antitoxin system
MEMYRIIIDTNLWISLLIGKRLSELYTLCNSDKVEIYICGELEAEFTRIASRAKIRKYVTEERINKTLDLMKTSCISSSIKRDAVSPDLRDVNDLYLIALSETVKADFILTGDKDLLSLKYHKQTKIVTYKEFEVLLSSSK